jgi:hypothetical protein
MAKSYTVEAHWDAEARVWHSTSDVPGLVIEAETMEEFEQLMKDLVPEMLAANADVHDVSVPVELIIKRSHVLAVA